MSLQYYLLFNPDLKKYDMTTIKKQLYDDIQTNNRITSIESFFKKYKEFDINIYKKFYPETMKMSVIETLIHMNTYYDSLNTIYSYESFLNKYPLFKELDGAKLNRNTIESYYEYHLNFNSLSNNETLIEQTIDQAIDQAIDQTNEQTIEQTNQNIVHNKNTLKLAHVFVHLFKIGGGEYYLKQFHKSNITNLFDETLFISRINHPHNIDTLFDLNGMTIIYYDSYEALNKYLHEYNIIIDHQLYWFESNITQIAFENLDKLQICIIRIIHGAPIHYQDIIPYNFTYSIELYKEVASHISWNNHIKHYINIGVEIEHLIKKELNNPIQIIIIGRICEEKVPYSFLKSLSNFLKNIENANINANINAKYKFNFYGIIDKTYEILFIKEVNRINKIYNSSIKYHGFIHPDKISDVYEINHILMHPSQNEAGATVILEAMSHGLPVICKNKSGMRNALGNNHFLCETDNDMFDKLVLINENNYNDISLQNRLKIIENNELNRCFGQLLNEIKMIHDINLIDTIPNIIHYIFGLIPQVNDFSFVYFMSIYSNYVINRPYIIYFHCQYEPHGYWWNKAKKYIKINYINAGDNTNNQMKWGKKSIVKYAHKADKLRLEILNKYGGVYMDIDTITIRPYHHLINDVNIDFVIGIQEENYLNRDSTLYCNAILMSKKNSPFIQKWMEMYENYFISDGWCEASVHLPQKVLGKMDKSVLLRIKILDKTAFYNPSYNEVDKIFESCNEIDKIFESCNEVGINNILINKYNDLLTLHLWNSYSNKYYKDIDKNGFFIDSYINTLYGQCVKHVINYENNNENYNQKICIRSKIHNLSIIMIYRENNIPEELIFKNILKQEYIYNLNIEIIIIDNSTKSNLRDLNNLYGTIFHKLNIKMIDLYIIETNDIYSDDICNKIGLEYANYETVFHCDINEELDKEEFIDFFNDSEEKSDEKNSNKILFNNYLQYINAIYKL